jgi:hypothetical protein
LWERNEGSKHDLPFKLKLFYLSRREVSGLLSAPGVSDLSHLGQKKVPLSQALSWKDESNYPFLAL